MTNSGTLASLGNRRYPGRSPEGSVANDDGRSRSTSLEDALSHHQQQNSNRAEEASGAPSILQGAALEPLLARFAALLADALAPRLAEALAAQTSPPTTLEPPLRRLVTLDQLAALL